MIAVDPERIVMNLTSRLSLPSGKAMSLVPTLLQQGTAKSSISPLTFAS
jgi:hypothetical protein